MIAHLVEFTETGWAASHPMWCDDPLGCMLSQLLRAMTRAPRTGRFWGAPLTVRGTYVLELGAVVPMEVQGNSRRTAGSYALVPERRVPGG
jgi:hypothetical protein